MSKRLWESKTFWVNLLSTVAAVGVALQGSELIAQYPQAVAVIGAVLGIVNIGLRLITDKPIQ